MPKAEAAVLRDIEDIHIETVEIAEPEAGEVLVDVKSTGICHTDYNRYTGKVHCNLPIVLGHESAGVVEDVGEGVTTVEPGDFVVLSVVTGCGKCTRCVKGEPYFCEVGSEANHSGTLLDGTRRITSNGEPINHFYAQSSFASKAVVPERSAVKVPNDAPLPEIALLGCGAATGIGGVINTAEVSAGDDVAIFGCGGVGMSALMAANVVGAQEIIAIDLVDNKLEMASTLGATEIINPQQTDPVEAVVNLTDGGVDHAFEFIGNTAVMQQAFEVTRTGGQTVLSGEAGREKAAEFNTYDLLHQKVIGNTAGSVRPKVDIPVFAEMVTRGDIDLSSLMSATYPLTEITTAFEEMENNDIIRSAIVFD